MNEPAGLLAPLDLSSGDFPIFIFSWFACLKSPAGV